MSKSTVPDTQPVAFFDFDGTLTNGDTLMPFLKFIVGNPTYYAKLALLSPVLGAYFAKLLRNDIAKQIVLKQYLAGYHSDELFELGERFGKELIPDMLRSEGMDKLEWHQAQGHKCVLVSASMDVYLKAWAKDNGMHDVLCTSLIYSSGGIFKGRINGNNCCGKEKKVRVSKWLGENNSTLSFGYGDTRDDVPMLKLVDCGMMLNKRGKNFEYV